MEKWKVNFSIVKQSGKRKVNKNDSFITTCNPVDNFKRFEKLVKSRIKSMYPKWNIYSFAWISLDKSKKEFYE